MNHQYNDTQPAKFESELYIIEIEMSWTSINAKYFTSLLKLFLFNVLMDYFSFYNIISWRFKQ